MIDQERFKYLLKAAIGDRTQQAFAEKTGLSRFTLSRYVAQGLTAPPRLGTLKNIAEASEGRVSYAELLHSVGFHEEAEKAAIGQAIADRSPFPQVPGSVRESAVALVKNIKDYISHSPSAKDLEELAGTLEMLYTDTDCHILTGDAQDYFREKGMAVHFGAERYAPMVAEWVDETCNLVSHLVFVVFFCETKGTQYIDPSLIIRDVAFDLLTLDALNIDEMSDMLQVLATTDNAKMSDYKLCLTTRKTIR